MKVESITIRNFKGIKNEQLSVKGNNVYVLGRNAMGKTSFLDAIFKIISGKDLPPQPTMQGESSGLITIDLGDIIVKSKFNSKTEKYTLSVESKDGAEFKSPRGMLDEKIGVIDFDIQKFFELAPKKQVEFIKGMAGIDFTDLDDAYKKAFEERTFINRKVKELEAKQVVFDKDKLEVKDLSEALAALTVKSDFNQSYIDVKKDVVKFKDRQTEIDHEVLELTEKINKLKAESQDLKISIHDSETWLNDAENKPYDLEKENAALLSMSAENEIITKNIEAKKLYDDFIKILEEQKNLNETIDQIETVKKNAIKEANLPVPGLSFNDDGLTYHGLPFEASQINRAQQIIIGLQINLALLGELKIARFDGSLIDNENMEYIEDWAQKNDLQLFVEFVDRNAEQLTIEVREV